MNLFKNGTLIALAAASLIGPACKKEKKSEPAPGGETAPAAADTTAPADKTAPAAQDQAQPSETTPAAGEKTAAMCMGQNDCKGKSACKSAKNDCKGKNACKGQGLAEMSEEDCKAKGGTVTERAM